MIFQSKYWQKLAFRNNRFFRGFAPLFICAAYACVGIFSLQFASINQNASPFWPASGFAIAAALLFGRRAYVGIFLGALITNLTTPIPFSAVVGIAMGNTLEAIIGASLFLWAHGNFSKSAYRKTIAILVSGIPSAILGGMIGTTVLLVHRLLPIENSIHSVVTWFGGDFVGILVFLPFFLTFARVHRAPKKIDRKKFLQFAILAGTLVGINTLVFQHRYPEGLYWANTLLTILGLIKISKLAGRTLLVLTSLVSIYFSHFGYSLFEFGNSNLNILYLQGITASLGVSLLFMEGVVRQRLAVVSKWVLFTGLPLIIVVVSYIGYKETHLKSTELQSILAKTNSSYELAEQKYTTLLLSGTAFMQNSEVMTAREWLGFIETLQIEKYFNAIHGIGWISEVPKKTVVEFEEKNRRGEHKDFKVRSLDPTYSQQFSNHYVITSVVPHSLNRAAIGLDVGSESRRRTAADKARATKTVQATLPIQLIQDSQKRPGFLIFYPAQKETFLAWIYAPVISEVFFQSALSGVLDELHISISIGNELIFGNPANIAKGSENSRYYNRFQKEIFGQSFTVTTFPTESFFVKNSEFPLVIGIVLTAFLTILTALISNISQFNKRLMFEVSRKGRELDVEKTKTIHSAKLASLGEMSAGIAHEINNPLAIIIGSISMLGRSRTDELKFLERVEKITKAADRIEKIVSGLRKFSRSTQEGEKKLEDLQAIVNDSLLMTNAKAARNFVDVKTEFHRKLIIQGSALEIEQVIVNLISNAIDAAKSQPEKWVRIVGLEEEDAIILRVLDSGSGISQAVETKLFQPFFTTKPVGEGTGLGLSISKGILEQHGAKFFLNRKFANTCFEIQFPKAIVSKKAA